MKKFLIGLIVGVAVALTLPAFAASSNHADDYYCAPYYQSEGSDYSHHYNHHNNHYDDGYYCGGPRYHCGY